jgi:tripartite-type tricarboxylate transporter receptor subunit TctC
MQRTILVAALALAGAATCLPAQAQSVGRVVSGYPAGGAIDQLARVFAEEFGKAQGRTWIVDTRTGAGGKIAVDHVKGAAPDGNTVLIAAASNITIYPHTVRKSTYEARDFVPVAIAGEYDTGIAVKANTPAGEFRAFLAQAKTDPVLATYATPGAGTMPHFYGLLLGQATGVPFKHIPYRGTGPAITDAIAGHVGSVISPIGTLVPHAKTGSIRVIATTGTRRSAQLPDVPTFRELGLPQLESSTWFGLFVPAGTPADVVARLNEIAARAVNLPAIREKLKALDLEPLALSPAEFATRVRNENEHWAKVVKDSGFVADSP